MADKSRFGSVNYADELDVETKDSLPAVRRHFMNTRKADNETSSGQIRTPKASIGKTQKSGGRKRASVKRPSRARKDNPQQNALPSPPSSRTPSNETWTDVAPGDFASTLTPYLVDLANTKTNPWIGTSINWSSDQMLLASYTTNNQLQRRNSPGVQHEYPTATSFIPTPQRHDPTDYLIRELNDEGHSPIMLREDEALSWGETAARSNHPKGQSVAVFPMQTRHLDLSQSLGTWQAPDVQALGHAHQYWEKCKWEIISAKMLDYGVQTRWLPHHCAQKWAEVMPQQSQRQYRYDDRFQVPIYGNASEGKDLNTETTESDDTDHDRTRAADSYADGQSSDASSDLSWGAQSRNLAYHLYDTVLSREVLELRRWLLQRFRSGLSGDIHQANLRNNVSVQHQMVDGGNTSCTPENQATGSSLQRPPPLASSRTETSLRKILNSRKRKDDDLSDEDDRRDKRPRPRSSSATQASAGRLACFYNKYDPIMYRSNIQTHKKFEICESHDFRDMNKLYEHLKRVHGDQPPQCPRCTRTDFGSSEELQAHQTAIQPCALVPVTRVRRIQWITSERRKSLQTDINRSLRGRAEEEKWTFAYRWLFPDAASHSIPSPYLQDSVISIVSSVIDDYECRLLDLIRQSDGLDDLESQIPSVRGQFLAQYGISINNVGSPLSNSQPTPSGSGSQTSSVRTPLDVTRIDLSGNFMSAINHNQVAPPAKPQNTTLNDNLTPSTILQPPLAAPDIFDWQQISDFEISMNNLYNWPEVHESSHSVGNKSNMPESFAQPGAFADYVLWEP